MSKNIICILFITLGLGMKAQESFGDKTKLGFIIGGQVNSLQSINMAGSDFNYTYQDKGAINVGIKFETKANEKLSIGYGISILNSNIERLDNCPNCTENVNRTNSFNTRHIILPLDVRYFFQQDRIDLFGIAGFTSMLLTKQSGSYVNSYGNTYEIIDIPGITSFNFGFNVGAGVNYNISYRGSIGLDLTYYHGLNPLFKDPNTKLSGVSINPGIYYQF